METQFMIPKGYERLLDFRETEEAIHTIKEFFQVNLAFELNLMRVTAPLFVRGGMGINDDLNGVERPVAFGVKGLDGTRAEIVQSLAKWKRMRLADFAMLPGEGIYTDMNAIRPDEVLDNLHSLYVDQWDWERVITAEDRTLTYLKSTVRKIYDVIRRTERYICHLYSKIDPILPEEITFVHSEELEAQYPELSPREREKAASKEFGAIFVIGIGAALQSGQPHDGRAPDYDDWSTPSNGHGYRGLNGDIVVYYPVLDCAYELSSMGIRVDAKSLLRQLELCDATDRKKYYFHQMLLKDELPLSIGGGIGQSRLCMFYLRKAHIGEIQASIWPPEMVADCKVCNVSLL